VQTLTPLAFSSPEKSVTVPKWQNYKQTNQPTNKQTVNDIPTPCLSASVDNKSLRCRWQTRATQWLSACYIFCIASYSNQNISSTRSSCWIQITTVGVINNCPTTARSLWHSTANSVDSVWDDQAQPFHRYGWCPRKFKWLTWPNQATFRGGLPSMG